MRNAGKFLNLLAFLFFFHYEFKTHPIKNPNKIQGHKAFFFPSIFLLQ